MNDKETKPIETVQCTILRKDNVKVLIFMVKKMHNILSSKKRGGFRYLLAEN